MLLNFLSPMQLAKGSTSFSINRWLRPMMALVLLSQPSFAHAHLVSTRFGEFYSGMLHPLTSLVHIVPWLALAIFSLMQSKAFARKSLLLFPLMVALGVMAGMVSESQWIIEDAVLLLNIASFIALGALVVYSRPIAPWAGLVLVALFALCHGYANGDIQLQDGSPLLYVAGVTTAAYLVVVLVAGAAALVNDQQPWGRIALRALGSWILAAGLIYGGFESFGVVGA